MYRSGVTVLPDMPTCLDLGIHPFSTNALEQDTWAPIFRANDSAMSIVSL